MSANLRLRLADGSEIDATIEGALSGQLRDLLAVGYAGNKMRVAGDESQDVEGHALAGTVNVRLFDEDDVEGHALTLHLPNAQAARDLQKKLMAAGVVGLIVVGAATTAVVAPELVGSGDQAAPAPGAAPLTRSADWDQAHAAGQYQVSGYGEAVVPPVAQGIYPGTTTPGYGESVVPPVAEGVYPEAAGAVAVPDISPGLKADIANGDAAAPGYGQSAVPTYPGSTEAVSQPAISPGLKAEIAAGEATAPGAADAGDESADSTGPSDRIGGR